jgi:mannose-6-phosphate isomerase-like protein (cupin superfamily)
VEFCLQPTAAEGDETALFGPARGCAAFDQRLLRPGAGAPERLHPDEDEVLYVVGGSGSAELDGRTVSLHPGTAAFVPRGVAWRVSDADGLELLSVLVPDPLPTDAEPAVVDVSASEDGTATAGRAFRLLATPEIGCASATQFVGYIPVGRAPDHYHHYDEVVYVLEGEGALHIGGETAKLGAGAAVHLPARLVHCLENTGPGELQVLGVFRPAGSPAEAYYPDGTRATY